MWLKHFCALCHQLLLLVSACSSLLSVAAPVYSLLPLVVVDSQLGKMSSLLLFTPLSLQQKLHDCTETACLQFHPVIKPIRHRLAKIFPVFAYFVVLSKTQKIFLRDNNCRICCAILCLIAIGLYFLSAAYFILLLFSLLLLLLQKMCRHSLCWHLQTLLVFPTVKMRYVRLCVGVCVDVCVDVCVCMFRVPRLPSLVRIFIDIVLLLLHWYRFHFGLFRCFYCC